MIDKTFNQEVEKGDEINSHPPPKKKTSDHSGGFKQSKEI